MPNIASAKKNMRKSRAAMVRNRAQRSALRTALKKGHASAAPADDQTTAVKLLDRAARKGLIHKNTAAPIRAAWPKPRRSKQVQTVEIKTGAFSARFFTSWPALPRTARNTTP